VSTPYRDMFIQKMAARTYSATVGPIGGVSHLCKLCRHLDSVSLPSTIIGETFVVTPVRSKRCGRSPPSTGDYFGPWLQGSSAGSGSSSGSGGSSFQSQYNTWIQRYLTGNDISAR